MHVVKKFKGAKYRCLNKYCATKFVGLFFKYSNPNSPVRTFAEKDGWNTDRTPIGDATSQSVTFLVERFDNIVITSQRRSFIFFKTRLFFRKFKKDVLSKHFLKHFSVFDVRFAIQNDLLLL